MESHARKVGAEPGRQRDDLARIGGAGTELAGKRPVGADVRGREAQVLLGVGLDLDAAQPSALSVTNHSTPLAAA